MALPPQKFRELVFQILYSQDIGFSEPDDMVSLMMKELSVTRKNVLLALQQVEEVQAIQEETDKMISQASFSYNFDRIQTVERNILRLGIYELLFKHDIPPKVAISEAMRLARKFGSPESAGFINAILDTLYKASKGEEVDPTAITQGIQEMEDCEKKTQDLPPAQPES
jgi:transcription antitermination protein NusB